MIVLYIFIPTFLLCELLRRFRGRAGKFQVDWQLADSLRFAVILVLCVIGSSHFSPLKLDMLAMLPPPIPKDLSIIYLTGLFEFAGAIGLLLPRTRILASYCLIVMLICFFPANIYAALNDIPFNGRAATPLIIRTPIQLLLIISLVFIAWHERKNRVYN
ncbi:hypothetical protein OFY17_06370 [Marinomonas sp. C2222]|uniref:DoxX family membrane protein n=1 Tax=Marinomonas sargassi TaxID=2984494 RepID=A0ABT2YRY2_9GAMM|nr:hypothetical protein [Marinomonas sargassi]MCV2402515.1 hypothetical protein [Marinomonas sargassi]